ncbi:MAG: DUF5603 domain-containing protein [Fervidicoccus fontis]
MSSREKVRIKIPKYDIPAVKLEYVLLDAEALLPHEEIVTERLSDVIRNIEDQGALDMPIIVAPIPGSSKYLIVDGHHRWAALMRLGCRKIPSVIVDYFDPRIEVFTWYPAFSGEPDLLFSRLSESMLDIKTCGLSIDLVTNKDLMNRAFLAFVKGGECISIEGDVEVQRRVLRILDELAVRDLIRLTWYGLLSDASEDLRKSEVDCVLVRRSLSKSEIMEYVRRGGVYPPKTTRHLLPFTPIKDYIKLEVMCT